MSPPKPEEALESALAALRREADAAKAEFARIQVAAAAQLAGLDAQIIFLDAAIAAEEACLPAPPTGGIIGGVSAMVKRADPLPRPLNHHGRYVESRHPFPVKAGNLKEWARLHAVDYRAVKRWYSRGKTSSPIPERWAAVILQEYGVALSSWPNGVNRRDKDGKLYTWNRHR